VQEEDEESPFSMGHAWMSRITSLLFLQIESMPFVLDSWYLLVHH
jgi:hypothetical protein